jgi:chemotaxis signal transduction protein
MGSQIFVKNPLTHKFSQIIQLWQFTNAMAPMVAGLSSLNESSVPIIDARDVSGVRGASQHIKTIFSFSHLMRSRSLIHNVSDWLPVSSG